jgi:hypothetical protein
MSTHRGGRFETEIGRLLEALAHSHRGLVDVNVQPEVRLLSGAVKRPDFELVYRLEQEHRELVEVQSREHSSAELAAKIKLIKSLSSRNRFVFVFEHVDALSATHRRELEQDGVQCLSPDDFRQKLRQLDAVLVALKNSARVNDADVSTRQPGFLELMQSLLKTSSSTYRTRSGRIGRGVDSHWRDDDIFRGPS